MPSAHPHRDGWVRVTRTSTWATIHPHLLVSDPTSGQSGLIRMDKLLANSLYGVHVGINQTARLRKLGEDTLRPAFIGDCFEELVALGLSSQPQGSREKTKQAVAIALARNPALCTPRLRDWSKDEIEESRHQGVFDQIPYLAPHGSDGSLEAVSDIFHYGGNFLRAIDRAGASYTGRIADFLTHELEQHDGALKEMPMRDKGKRLLALLAQAKVPSFLELSTDRVEETYAHIEARVKWSHGSEEERERVIMGHALELLKGSEEVQELQDLLMKGSQPVVSNQEAAELIRRVARLVKSSAFEHRHLRIASMDAVRKLETFLHKHRALYTRDAVVDMPPKDRVTMLEQRQELAEASWRGSNSGGILAGGATGFPREMADALAKELNSEAAMDLEDKIESVLQLPDTDGQQGLELCHLITSARAGIMLKVLLGHISWLHVKPTFGKVIAQVRPHWNRFATLVLVAGIDGWRKATDRQLDFELPASVLDKVRLSSDKVSIINDIYTPIAREVLKAAKRPDRDAKQQLLDEATRSKERQLGDRMFWLLGYGADALGGDTDDSFAAVIDCVSDFIELGAPLGGQRALIHEGLAVSFYQKARREHREAYDRWAHSKDPAHRHPGRWLPQNAACKASITANRARLLKLLDIIDYAPEIMQGAVLCFTALLADCYAPGASMPVSRVSMLWAHD